MNMNVPDDIKEYLTDAYQTSQKWSLPNNRGNFQNSESIQIETAAVIGGGTMGRGIAISLSRAGFRTIIVENDEKNIEWCRKELNITYSREKQLKRLNDEQIQQIKSNIQLTTNLSDFHQVDLVIEAVFENMKLKKELFEKLDQICKSECIFGTNTSSLDIDEMSKVLKNRSRLVGIHFFNPAHLIRMVEIIYGSYTSPTSVATAFKACQLMKKLPVLVGNCPAFVFNRLLSVYLEQSQKLMYIYGFLPHHIDKTITSFGFLMGPLTVADMNGIDVMEKLKKEQNIELNPLEKVLISHKRYGRKTNKGFYKYDPITYKKENDMEIERIIKNISENSKINIQLICDQDLINFLLFPMVNEGFLCIEEGIIEKENLIDIMFILGFGWPPAFGGPMKFGRKFGIKRIANTISLWHSLEPNDRVYKLSKTLENYNKEIFSAKI